MEIDGKTLASPYNLQTHVWDTERSNIELVKCLCAKINLNRYRLRLIPIFLIPLECI